MVNFTRCTGNFDMHLLKCIKHVTSGKKKCKQRRKKNYQHDYYRRNLKVLNK